MYEIHWIDGSGMKELVQRCDVRMNIMMQHRVGREIECVLKGDEDVTDEVIRGLPL